MDFLLSWGLGFVPVACLQIYRQCNVCGAYRNQNVIRGLDTDHVLFPNSNANDNNKICNRLRLLRSNTNLLNCGSEVLGWNEENCQFKK